MVTHILTVCLDKKNKTISPFPRWPDSEIKAKTQPPTMFNLSDLPPLLSFLHHQRFAGDYMNHRSFICLNFALLYSILQYSCSPVANTHRENRRTSATLSYWKFLSVSAKWKYCFWSRVQLISGKHFSSTSWVNGLTYCCYVDDDRLAEGSVMAQDCSTALSEKPGRKILDLNTLKLDEFINLEQALLFLDNIFT